MKSFQNENQMSSMNTKQQIKDVMDNHKYFDTIKSQLAKNPDKLDKMDKAMLIEKLKSEGILDDIVNSLPMKNTGAKAAQPIDVSGSDSLGHQQRDNSLGRGSVGGRRRTSSLVKDGLNRLDKDKRYLSVNVVHGVAFVDFVNPRDDEEISIAVSFLKNRYMTKKVQANCEFNLGETFIFELEGDFAPKAFDASLLLKLN